METEALAAMLREQADDLIGRCGLDSVLSRYGKVFYTGSYSLDTLVYPDLDVQILLDGDPMSLPSFFDIGKELAELDDFIQLSFQNFRRRNRDPFPDGLYWGIKTMIGTTDRKWKIDLWAKSAKEYDEHIELMEDIRRRITEPIRKLIIEFKRSILTPEGRTPSLSGYHIYQAVLFHGLTERQAILDYLRAQGIEIDE